MQLSQANIDAIAKSIVGQSKPKSKAKTTSEVYAAGVKHTEPGYPENKDDLYRSEKGWITFRGKNSGRFAPGGYPAVMLDILDNAERIRAFCEKCISQGDRPQA